MKTLSRYFIFSYFYSYDGGGASATIPVITTDGSYPNRDRLVSEHKIISNVLKVVHVSEVKSKQDLDDFFGYNVDISKHILNKKMSGAKLDPNKFSVYRADYYLNESVFHGSFDTLSEARIQENKIKTEFSIRLKNGKFADAETWIVYPKNYS